MFMLIDRHHRNERSSDLELNRHHLLMFGAASIVVASPPGRLVHALSAPQNSKPFDD